MKKLTGLIVFVFFALVAWRDLDVGNRVDFDGPGSSSALISKAFESRQSDVQVQGQGEVLNVLPDDTDGSRHQRFILRLDSELTVLIAHNIDLAPRIDSLRKGDRVEFFGEYEWNAKGGVIHWTHHDPQGRHVDGWLKHEGRIYK